LSVRGAFIIVTKTKKSADSKLLQSAIDEKNIPIHAARSSFPIVGIGASAGGLAAFEAFFSSIPQNIDPDMAFVLVQHLAPDHKSLLAEIIQGYTKMPVFMVEDGMQVQSNRVYIIPPNHDMTLQHGNLQLLAPTEPRGQRMTIDFFFRSLAEELHERAIGIVLSGTGSDGTLGVRAIKAEGGMIMVQSPDSSEFDTMPRNAIATGMADYELAPDDMPAQLMSYVDHVFRNLPPSNPLLGAKSDSSLQKIFSQLRSRTGHDFSQYKRSTIDRRIGRRMAVHEIDVIEEYVELLEHTPAEVEALFRDLLIGVTNFFRDPKSFKVLQGQIVPNLLQGKSPDAVIRVWSAGCSTGEEAYSLAILFRESMEALKQSYTVQIFATDIDSQAIATARAGTYSASIAADVSAERLARFFVSEPEDVTYRICKQIRDMLIFSEQDIVKDPPFSKLDMISCRNLLIYLDTELQKKLIPLFHYALKPGGVLFLGASEGVGAFDDLFATLDRESKVYQRKDDIHGTHRAALGRFLDPVPRNMIVHPPRGEKPALPAKIALRDFTEHALIQHVAPPSVLINEHGDILYLHGRTGMFLEPAPGVAGINNILKMAREGLLPGLTTTLHKAVESKEEVHCPGLRVKTNGHFTFVNLSIYPLAHEQATPGVAPLYLVTLDDTRRVAPDNMPETNAPQSEADARITTLTLELKAKDEYIQATQEQLMTSTEELKASNEEMQSVNEELQSANEELETSKEELQSVNEELATVNAELQAKVSDLSRANNDMNNLLAGTGIGTIFVDHQLRILRFTPAASAIINLIAGDKGRPVGHLVSNLIDYDNLVADVQSVLDTLASKEVEVQAKDGKWYAMRIQPYRTLDNVIEGAVISFVDITEIVQIRNALEKANTLSHLASVVHDVGDAITVQDLKGHMLSWNAGARKMYGWTEAEALLLSECDRIAPEIFDEESNKLRRVAQGKVLDPYRTRRLAKNGASLEVWMLVSGVINEAGKIYAIATVERGIAA